MRPTLSLLLAALLLLPAATAWAGEDRDSALYQRSYDQESAGSYAEALATLKRITGAERQTYVWLLRHAWLAYLAGEHDESVKAYEAAVGKAPRAVEPRLGMTLPLMAKRRWKRVAQAAEGVLKLAPAHTTAMSRLALARYRQGRYGKAAKQYRRVLELFPSDVEIRTGLGWALLKQGKGAEAAREFERVLKVAPKQASAREGLLAVKGEES